MPYAICPSVKDCLDDISMNRDGALAMSRNQFDFIKGAYKDETGNFKLKSLATNIVTVPIEMLLSKGNPLLARLNSNLLYIIETGLIN